MYKVFDIDDNAFKIYKCLIETVALSTSMSFLD